MSQCQNHQHCIDDALANAHEACLQAEVRLTPLREQLLKLIWQSHKSLGAYELMDMLAELSERRVAPPTVYRTLDFLMELGLIHKINSLNTFVGCPSPATKHPSYFLICTQCHTASECHSDTLSQQVDAIGAENHFIIKQQRLEVLGLCNDCQEQK